MLYPPQWICVEFFPLQLPLSRSNFSLSPSPQKDENSLSDVYLYPTQSIAKLWEYSKFLAPHGGGDKETRTKEDFGMLWGVLI